MKARSIVVGFGVLSLIIGAAGCGDNAQTSAQKEDENRSTSATRTSDREASNTGLRSAPATGGVRDGAMDRALADNADKQTMGVKADYNGIAKPINGSTNVDRPSPIDTRPETNLGVSEAVSRDVDMDATAKPRAADNSGQNEADKAGTSVTPLDQGTSESDITVTRTIRKAVTGDSTLSTNAQNIKIITLDGVVVLRGPVASQAEVETILTHARTASGATRIDNQLAVATP